MEPITEDLSLCKQNMFSIEMESENFISTKLWLKSQSDDSDNPKDTTIIPV